MSKHYWWHGLPWLVYTLIGMGLIGLMSWNVRNGEWIVAVIDGVAVLFFWHVADKHKEKYDQIHAGEPGRIND